MTRVSRRRNACVGARRYDADGSGILRRDEVGKILLELDLLSDLTAEEQIALIDEEFEAAGERGTEDEDGEGSPRAPTDLEEKKRQRMLRNRRSAATSRERKRKYIQELENRVDELTEVVRTLQEENTLMRFLDLRHEECAALSFLDSIAI